MQTATKEQAMDSMEKELRALPFLQTSDPYTIEQAREVIRIIFKTKTSGSLSQFTAYRLKSMLEWVADYCNETGRATIKPCSEGVISLAVQAEGFVNAGKDGHDNYNISTRDYLRIHTLVNKPKRVYSLFGWPPKNKKQKPI